MRGIHSFKLDSRREFRLRASDIRPYCMLGLLERNAERTHADEREHHGERNDHGRNHSSSGADRLLHLLTNQPLQPREK